MLDTTLRSFEDSEAACNAAGGRLISYSSVRAFADQASPVYLSAHHRPPMLNCIDAEQLEVEGFMASRGYLLPGFHTFYWIGLRLVDLPWPNFVWMDPALPAPSIRGGSGGSSHWGTVRRALGPVALCRCHRIGTAGCFIFECWSCCR